MFVIKKEYFCDFEKFDRDFLFIWEILFRRL